MVIATIQCNKNVYHLVGAKNLDRLGHKLKLKKNISILSDVCEALIGAIYLDSNLENAKKGIVLVTLWEGGAQKVVPGEGGPRNPWVAIEPVVY